MADEILAAEIVVLCLEEWGVSGVGDSDWAGGGGSGDCDLVGEVDFE